MKKIIHHIINEVNKNEGKCGIDRSISSTKRKIFEDGWRDYLFESNDMDVNHNA